MKNCIHLLFAVTLSVPVHASITYAEDAPKLEGSTFLDQDTCPKGAKSADCVFSFELSGANAKILYEGMRVKAVVEECIGGHTKDDGNGLRCYKADDGKYSCDFGYAFAKKRFTYSKVDC